MDLHVFPILNPTSHLPPHPIPLGHPSAPAPSTCLMHPTWAGDLFHTWESLGLQKIQPVHPKRNQSWILIGRTDTEAETPTLWPTDVKNGLIGKDPDAGEDWRQEEKRMTEDEMVG